MVKLSESSGDCQRETPRDQHAPHPLAALGRIPVKYIYFHQDVRPAYVGTYTRLQSRHARTQISRNPTSRVRPELQYDYDSEAEWEEPEDGEDISSDAESEVDSVEDAEEMDEFLVDEDLADSARSKKRYFVGDMEPVSTDLCWEDAKGSTSMNTVNGQNMNGYRLEVIQSKSKQSVKYGIDVRLKLTTLEAHHQLPINPFSTEYWPSEGKQIPTVTQSSLPNTEARKEPLQVRLNAMAVASDELSTKPPDSTSSELLKTKPPKSCTRLLTGADLTEFKQAVEGSALKKAELLSVLKKRYVHESRV